MLANIAVLILGVLVFLYIFWKRLKEDYVPEIIFKTAFCVLVGVFVSNILSNKFFPGWFLWFSFLGTLVGLTFGIFVYKVRFYEALEALVISFLPWVSLLFLSDSVVHYSLSSFIGFIAILVIIFISFWINDHYKNFSWYKSGKIGFAGLATLAIIFLIRSAIAISGIHVLSFVGQRYEAMVSGSLAFISCLLIYNLGRNQK